MAGRAPAFSHPMCADTAPAPDAESWQPNCHCRAIPWNHPLPTEGPPMSSLDRLTNAIATDPELEAALLAVNEQGETTAHTLANDLGIGPAEAIHRLEELRERGLVDSDSIAAGLGVDPTHRGRAVHERLKRMYGATGSGLRLHAVRRGILMAMSGERRVDSESLAEDWPSERPDPSPTATEVQDGFEYLKASALIKATGTMQGLWIGLSITGSGRDALGSNRFLVDEQETTSYSYSSTDQSQTMNNYGPVGAASQGSHNTVTGTVNVLSAEQASTVRDLVDEALDLVDQLPEDSRDDVQVALEDLRDSLDTPEPKKHTVRNRFRSLTSLLGGIGTGAAAAVDIMAVADRIAPIISQIPG
ncbi:hypothetical protein V6N00_13515 [Tersicoccus sp. MR15.9]|uniref:hypothetical protein n=1 Tax=Tersicoccus mangrovi TaxID=3121635 RepID=UPI002FE60FE3